MSRLGSSVSIAAPAEELFDLSQDYERRLEWDPFLVKACLVGDAVRADVGARAWCVSRRPRLGMETEYVSFRRPAVAAVRMTRGPWFLDSFAGSWRFEPDPGMPGNTLVHFTYNVRARPRFAGALLDPILEWFLAREVAARLEGLRAFVEQAEAA